MMALHCRCRRTRTPSHMLHGIRGLLLLVALGMAIPPSAYASERGAVLILGADCVGDTCVVGTYGSGAIVKLDEHKNTAYVLTARHVARAADDLYVLYDPISLPSDLSFGLENGVVPDELAAVLEERGHPRPTQVRSGIPFGGPQVADGDSLYLLTESWILTGSGRQYLALPQTEYLELYHLLPAAFARESGAALDVALLAVEEFPHFERQPVVYLAEPDSIGRGTKVTTIGCECGSNEGISQAQVQGTVVSRDSEFLHYRSLLVRAAYTGGPVFLGDHVVAMNVCDDRQVGLPIRARLASTFKELVDEWIGLPRMTADLTIDSPEGARDEVVSVDQDFVVRARARLDPEGPMLAPVGEVRLEPHDSFRTDDEPAATLALGEDVTWTLSSPARATGTLPIRVVTDDSALGLESIPLAEVGVATEEGVLLKCIVVEGPSDGSEVFVKDDFSVDISFDQSGHPLSDLVGTVTIDVARDQFGVLGGQYSQAIRTQGPIRWWLRPKSVCRQAPISLVVDLHTMDRNGKPVRVELPDTIRVNIEVSRKVQLHVGLGRIAP